MTEEDIREHTKEYLSELGKKDEEKEWATSEKVLKAIALIILILGITATLICAFTITYTETRLVYDSIYEFNPEGFVTTMAVLIMTLVSYSVMTVIAEISETLKQINKKM